MSQNAKETFYLNGNRRFRTMSALLISIALTVSAWAGKCPSTIPKPMFQAGDGSGVMIVVDVDGCGLITVNRELWLVTAPPQLGIQGQVHTPATTLAAAAHNFANGTDALGSWSEMTIEWSITASVSTVAHVQATFPTAGSHCRLLFPDARSNHPPIPPLPSVPPSFRPSVPLSVPPPSLHRGNPLTHPPTPSIPVHRGRRSGRPPSGAMRRRWCSSSGSSPT